MKDPQSETQNQEEVWTLRTDDHAWKTRSVWECGGVSPFSSRSENPATGQSARGVKRLAHSKTWRLIVALFALIPITAIGQSYSIDWHTIDGGGGTSMGGVYSVSGTIGQPDAGKMSGGNFTIDGGFWGLIAAVQTPGAPLLSIAHTTTNTVAVLWPSPSTGFNLQVNTNGVASVNWSNIVTTPSDDGATKTVVINPPTGNRFYRLFRP